jgi:hypothetical protein
MKEDVAYSFLTSPSSLPLDWWDTTDKTRHLDYEFIISETDIKGKHGGKPTVNKMKQNNEIIEISEYKLWFEAYLTTVLLTF